MDGHMGPPLYCYVCAGPGWNRKIELSPSQSDVVMSWLRLQTHLECIPHPNHMYTKCFSTLIRCGWAYGCALTLLPILLGSYFVVLCHLWSQHDVIMSWLRLTATSNWFPHPYYTYTKCLSTLICCPLAYTYSKSLTQLYRSYFGVLGHLWSQHEMSTRCGWGWGSPQTASPIHIRHIQSVWAHCYAVLRHTVTVLNSYTHPTWLIFWGPSVSLVDSKWCDYVMVEADRDVSFFVH